jgi:hypothetical protein
LVRNALNWIRPRFSESLAIRKSISWTSPHPQHFMR